MWASVEPTRPHPMITMCMIILPAALMPEERYALRTCGASRGSTPAMRAGSARGTMVSVSNEQAGPIAAGQLLDLTVAEAVHGGWCVARANAQGRSSRSEEHTSELQSRRDLVCRLLLEKKKKEKTKRNTKKKKRKNKKKN